jgi:uncharacterized protein (TIGR02271 family)
MNEKNKNDKSKNPDPITGQPGSHPVGTGIGAAAGGAATGAAVGSVAGPVGTVAGVAAGAVIGGLVGKGVAEKVNPTQEDMYWRHNHFREPYGSRPYSEFQSAYRAGFEGYSALGGGSFDEKEAEIRRRYEADKANARLPWNEARQAARAAWHRLEGNSERLIGFEVQDQNANAVGKVHSVWTDESQQPVFLGVRTGWILGKNHVVPAHNAKVNSIRRIVQLPFSESQIKSAPAFDESAELADDDEASIFRHYGIARTANPGVSGTQCDTPRAEHEKTIPLREEKLKVGKREVEAGGVRIRKIVRTETVNMPVELKREEFVMERVPASEMKTGAVGAIGEEDIYLPLRREEVVVNKETEIREGVRIGRKSETEQQTVTGQVRKEDIKIEREGGRKAPKP